MKKKKGNEDLMTSFLLNRYLLRSHNVALRGKYFLSVSYLIKGRQFIPETNYVTAWV